MESRERKVQIGEAAPDFAAMDCRGVPFRLSDLRGTKHVVLALNRGFICPYCIRNMARLHAERDALRSRGAEIVIVGPDGPEAFRRHWERNGFDFVGIPDPERRILRKYGQEVKLMRLGRLPATLILDRAGIVRYVHYGGSMMDIPAVDTLISEIEKLNAAP
jgi:peroxiredoxin Q/BCP